MYLLYTDEVNLNPADGDFFIYAGVSIPGDQAGPFSEKIEGIRASAGYKPEDILKFNTRERPKDITPQTHAEVKKQLIAAAANHGVLLFASFILHNVATSPEEARRNEINRVCHSFNSYLHWANVNDYGFVIVDTFTESSQQKGSLFSHLKEKFSIGLKGNLPFSKTMSLRRILGYATTSVGTSHLCSLVDVVIGSLRFAVNNRNVDSKKDTAKLLMQQLAPLCIRDSQGKVDELSIFYSPITIRAPKYLAKYRDLHDFLAAGGIEAVREPQAEV